MKCMFLFKDENGDFRADPQGVLSLGMDAFPVVGGRNSELAYDNYEELELLEDLPPVVIPSVFSHLSDSSTQEELALYYEPSSRWVSGFDDWRASHFTGDPPKESLLDDILDQIQKRS